ncbi:MAG: outer membrane protein transport protein [Nevskia sp.]
MSIRRIAAPLLLCGLVPLQAQATLGLFEHGTGIASLGFGGISYVGDNDSTAISANPASAIALGSRFDLGSDLLLIKERAQILGNAAGPDASYRSDGKHLFPIPQGGVTLKLSESWSAGVAAFAAGLGPDYTQGPYQRFAQTPQQRASAASAQNSIKIAGLSLVLAHVLRPGQSLGLGVNVQHQTINVKGAAPFANLSEAPDAVSDTGKHGAFGVSATVGWSGTITPWLKGGLSYRTKTWTQRIEGYRGLLPDHGLLELPSIFGGGLAATPAKDWLVAVEFQRFDYARVHAFGNSIDLLFQGRALGSNNGPGFGWKSQNVYKLGLSYQPLPALTLRGGFSYATQIIPRSQTLFNLLAPATPQLHYTLGLSYALDARSEFSFFGALAQTREVRGQNSIPAAFGGGEANVRNRIVSLGLSYGRRFGLAH